MRIVVIGGSGHIGTFLVPRLVRAGHEVVNISRGGRKAYSDAPEWQNVQQVVADRQREDTEGTFGDTGTFMRTTSRECSTSPFSLVTQRREMTSTP